MLNKFYSTTNTRANGAKAVGSFYIQTQKGENLIRKNENTQKSKGRLFALSEILPHGHLIP